MAGVNFLLILLILKDVETEVMTAVQKLFHVSPVLSIENDATFPRLYEDHSLERNVTYTDKKKVK